MPGLKFDPAKLERLNDPARFERVPPEFLWDALGDPNPATIVDLGAGTGLYAARFAELAPGATVYAVDVEPAMIAWLHDHRVPTVGDRFVPIQSAESEIPLGTGAADLAFALNLHHELDDPAASYAELLRILEPGGLLLVSDWKPSGEAGGPPNAHRVTGEQIAATLRTVGFVDTSVHDELPAHSVVTARRP